MKSDKGKKSSQGTDRIPPQALDVERTILGSMLIDSMAVDIALEFLTDDCFYPEAHTKIFIAMKELVEKNCPVDFITLSDKLRQKGWMEEIGSEGYLSELAGNVATAGNVEHYASIVRGKAILRRLISATAEIATECFSAEQDPQEVLDAAEHKIFGIAESRIKNKVISTEQLAPLLIEKIKDRRENGTISGIPTGFMDLDRLTAGLQNGDLIILGGRPAMGKTAFCLSVGLYAAIQARCPIVIFSLEMSMEQIFYRMLSAEARINLHVLRSGTLPKRDIPQLEAAAKTLSEAPIFIDHTPGLTTLELRAKARRLKAQQGIALIVVDYLQLLTPTVKMNNLQQEISQISRALKGIATELDVPVIALSQLSRAVEQRSGDHRPQLSDLRESGAIEQDADLVMFIYRPELYEKEDRPELKGKAEIIVGKQRNGPIGSVEVAFLRDFARFENLSDRR
jgi:replicative DNA helicase